MSNNITEIIFHGESTEVLKGLEDNSIDSVVCDPPYGLSKEPDISKVISEWVSGDDSFVPDGKGFMSKEWDGFVPPPSLWKEVYRVLKPGGHALVFAGTRTQDLMTISLRMAGFEVRDVIEWLYFSGFPKSYNVSKAFDKRLGRRKVCARKLKEKLIELRDDKGFTNSELNKLCGFEASNFFRTDNHLINVFPKGRKWKTLKKILSGGSDLDKELDMLYKEANREKVGESITRIDTPGIPTEGRSSTSGVIDITAPATDLAKQWDGWGTALKPAHEPIIVVRKPLHDGKRKLTVADCVERYGTGAINIDASRIDSVPRTTHKGVNRRTTNAEDGSLSGNKNVATFNLSVEKGEWKPSEKRFPANCITLDSDEFYSKYFNVSSVANVSPAELSKKASKKDRNSDWKGEEIDLLEKESPSAKNTTTECVTCNKRVGGRQYRDCVRQGHELREVPINVKSKNNHPTVKPTDLMAWLVRLVTPPNGVVLDPFAGSGSTLVAAKREGFGFIGIEQESEYVEIAEARTGVDAS